jgi:hypothetical protein
MIIECGLTEEEELYLDKMIEKIESQGYKIHREASRCDHKLLVGIYR